MIKVYRHTAARCVAAAALFSFTAAIPALGQTQHKGTSSSAVRYADQLSEAFKEAGQAVEPSVVHITATSTIEPTTNEESGPSIDPFAQDFLRRFFGDRVPEGSFGFGRQAPFEMHGEASGVIYDEDGYIVTNNHVVANADDLEVLLNDGRRYPATVVGTDPETDLALIKIDAEGFVPAKFGDSDAMEVGEWVLAVGCPFGLDNTVTAGIVSATGRSNVGVATFEDFIQTDAAINPGNSGGPLVNLHGQVVGINTAITTRSGGYMGVGFAIPSAMVESVVNSLRSQGSVTRGWLGVSIQPLTADLAKSFGSDTTNGALVAEVLPGGPADKAGLEAGDIITSVNGKPVNTTAELLAAVATDQPGSRMDVKTLRDGKAMTFAVTLGERPGAARASAHPSMGHRRDRPAEYGLAVVPLTPDLARQLGTDLTTGVVIRQVEAGSPAADAGLRPGDVIIRAGDQKVESIADLEQALNDAGRSGLRLLVRSRDMSHFVLLKRPA